MGAQLKNLHFSGSLLFFEQVKNALGFEISYLLGALGVAGTYRSGFAMVWLIKRFAGKRW